MGNKIEKSNGRKCLTILAGRASLLLCLSLMFQPSYAESISVGVESNEFHAVAQQGKTVSGVVKDQNGEPLIGVGVVLKGTTTGTATDFDGNFTLDLPTDKGTLVFSFIGFKTQEIDYKGQATINVELK